MDIWPAESHQIGIKSSGSFLFPFFYVEIITGIKVDKNNTYGQLKLSVWIKLSVATLKWNKGVFSLPSILLFDWPQLNFAHL